MAVGLEELPPLLPVPGVRLAATEAGIRYAARRDLVLIESDAGSSVAAVFTRNRFCAAPVVLARRHMSGATTRALVINAGNANAGTGDQGLEDARRCCQAVAQQLAIDVEQVLPFSTGVIGELLPVERMIVAIPAAVAALSSDAWADAAHGIMTTDTVAKGSSRQIELDGKTVTLTGIVKGAGMIRPDMATLLCFIATDAAVEQQTLQQLLQQACAHSFHRITVDGDTSTNDACVLIASGQAGNTVIDSQSHPAYAVLAQALNEMCLELAQAVIRDAEGVTKFITIEVVNGASERDCMEVAYTIAHSPLVKTAFFASDPNWGRILAAIGRAPIERLDVSGISMYLNEVCVLEHGALARSYTEAQGQAVMRESEIQLRVDLASGSSSATVWTSDLSHDYVRINAEYRS